MNDKRHKLVIIGSGPAGLTAAIYAGRANLKPLCIQGSLPGGQLMGTTAVENWPGYVTVMGPELMILMQKQAEQCGTTFLAEQVTKVDFSQRPFKLMTNKKQTLLADCVIIATGALPKRLQVPGEDTYWGKGVTSCAVCDGAFYADKEVIIVGGGDTAMEDASFMLKYTNKITVIHILDKLTASAAMQQRILNRPEVKIIYHSTIVNIDGDGSRPTQVTITDQKTKKETVLKTSAVFIAIGYEPNTAMLNGHVELDKWGYIQVTKHTHTSVDGVFVAGDVADYRYRQAVTSAGSGCMAALDAERWLNEQK